MSNEYNRLVAYILWITRKDIQRPEKIIIQRKEKLELPISNKSYKLTLRNVKLYIEELKEYDSSISEICIDKISRIGLMKWE